ncbi:MAG: hypothetical protein HQL61_03135 [Magnetococcales bacterium]|nr:hypothetical protein [Nitrospirota bacterium]
MALLVHLLALPVHLLALPEHLLPGHLLSLPSLPYVSLPASFQASPLLVHLLALPGLVPPLQSQPGSGKG